MNIETNPNQINFDAVFESAENMESDFTSYMITGAGGLSRRKALAVLSKPSTHFYELPMDELTREVFLESAESLTEYIEMMESHMELMNAARARLFAILQHHFPESETH